MDLAHEPLGLIRSGFASQTRMTYALEIVEARFHGASVVMTNVWLEGSCEIWVY